MLQLKGWIIAGLSGVLFFMLVSKSVKQPLMWLWKGLLYSAVGSLVIFLLNFLGQSFHLSLPINPLTALIIGFLRVPGLAYLIAVKLLVLH